ncbi:MAG: TlpA family protein disulfide reductase [Rhodobiaceae bacterium]|nr:TlpA family protein disulfide reductase [Rhodobiaceae bacterium]
MKVSPRVVALAGIVVVAVAAAVVYAMFTGKGNDMVADLPCAATPERLAAMKAAATGEVAAVQVPDAPVALPDLAFLNARGEETTLDAWKGKTLLVNLWATWCVPCREEMPDFAAVQTDMGGDAFEIVPINLDRGGGEKPAAFFKEIGVTNLPLNTDPAVKVFETLKAEGLAFGLPSTLIVDEAGCRIGNLVGPAHWDSADGRAFIEAALGKTGGS